MRSLLVLVVLAAAALPAHAELGVNFYGLSYHFDRDKARALGVDNEVNPGIGLRWRSTRERWEGFADAGFYRDSGRSTARLAGAGALWHVTGAFRLGGALAVLRSDTYNRGRTFLAPLPVAAWEFRRATLNVVYLPKVSEVNDINTLGFWLTFWGH